MNFEVEAYYPLKIFKDNDIPISWATIKVGYDLNRLLPEEISLFAMDYAQQNPHFINKDLSDLALGVEGYEIAKHLNNIFQVLELEIPKKNSAIWNKEWRKWRYCIMREMLKYIQNDEELLEKIEGVYADFGYPEDMKHLIYYMPLEKSEQKEYASLSPTEARKNLVKQINQFLEKEKIIIEANGKILPKKLY